MIGRNVIIMPELADVEGFRRVLDEHAKHCAVYDVEVADGQVLRGFSAGELRDVLCGNQFGDPERYGKWLVVPLRSARGRNLPDLMIHFG